MQKYLSEQELLEFIEWCKLHKIKQREVAKIGRVTDRWISQIFVAAKKEINENSKGDINNVKKPRLSRLIAEKVFDTINRREECQT